ncbi:MAG TPA: DUF5668 domain-containing protein [Symbiobacteriaceae bacterium]|nr:DUF5668 domain-containing protein [Symbiobacteriaceae bacterium]
MRINTGGVILILIGVFFLLTNFGFIAWGSIWKFWPVILVAAGVGMLFPRKDQN